MTAAPRFTLVTVLDASAPSVLKDMLVAVRAQTDRSWEWLVVAPDATQLRAAASEARIRLIQAPDADTHVAAARALADARGEFVGFLAPGDILAPTALAAVASVLADDVDAVSTDSDTLVGPRRFADRFEKPIWSPERLLGHEYLAHLLLLRRALVADIGGLRAEFGGAAEHDLALRVTERARRVVHVPEPLCHRLAPVADADAATLASGRRAVAEALARRGIDAEVIPHPDDPQYHRIVRRLDPAVTVSLVIPTMGSRGLVWGTEEVLVVEAVRSALAMTDHPHVEIVVVYDDHMDPGVLDELSAVAGDRLVAVEYTKKFNFSEKINLGALHSTGDVIVLLNDDVRVRSQGWLEQLVAPLADASVGMTGAKLYFADGTLQHGGHCYRDGAWGHPYIGWEGDDPGRFGALRVNREVSGVTAACAALRHETFFEVGGLTETLPVNYNDVDLCYKVRRAGHRILYIAGCELYHFESKSREPGAIARWEREATLRRWDTPGRDPYTPETDL